MVGMSTSRSAATNSGHRTESQSATEEPVTTRHDTTPAKRREDLTIDCDCCALKGTSACEDCVVTFLLEREPDDAVVIDADEARAMRMLGRAGLVPSLRFTSIG